MSKRTLETSASERLANSPIGRADERSASATPNVWVVVPAYNESARLRSSLQSVCKSNAFQVVIVDDGSKDGTFEEAKQLSAWVLRHPFNCGQGAALRTGIEFALSHGAEFVVTFDADGQHDATEIHRLLEPVVSGEVDVALGSRFQGTHQSMPLSRKCLLTAAVVFTRLTTGLSLTDAHNGFRAFSRKAASQIHIQQPRMAHASEILDQIAAHRLSYQEVPVTIRYTEETLEKGQSSWDALRIGSHLILERLAR